MYGVFDANNRRRVTSAFDAYVLSIVRVQTALYVVRFRDLIFGIEKETDAIPSHRISKE